MDERISTIRLFQEGKRRQLVCHPAAAAHGITLTRARFNLFYSFDYSAELHEQARRRIYRHGQKNACVHFYLVAKDTVDERVLKVLKGKMSAADSVKELLSGAKICLAS